MRRGFGRLFAVIALVACSSVAHLGADNVTGVSEIKARKLGALIRPGDILVWNCPTCAGAIAMRVNSIEVGRDGLSPQYAVKIKRDILIQSLKTYEALGTLPCAQPDDPNDYEEYEPEIDWTVDLTYTYFQKDKTGSWITLGSVVGVDNNPVPSITLDRAALDNIKRCVAEVEGRKKPPAR